MTTETTQTAPALGMDIPALVDAALADPEAVLNRLREYEIVERRQGHVPYRMSILRYALSGYLTAMLLKTEPERFTLGIEVDDEGVIVSGDPKPDAQTTGPFELRVAYPTWLASFFEDEANFRLLDPKSTDTLEDGLLTLGMHLDTLRAEAEAASVPDEDEDEDEDEDDWDDEDEDEDEDEEDYEVTETGVIVTDEPDEDEEEDEDEDDESEEDPDDDLTLR